MLQRLADIILGLTDRDILGDKLPYTVAPQNDFFPLVRLLLAHNGLDSLGCEFSFIKELSHTDSLVVRRCAVVQVDFINNITLTIFVKIRQLNGGSHFDTPLVNKFKQFGNKVRQANISAYLFSTFANFISKFLVCTQLLVI